MSSDSSFPRPPAKSGKPPSEPQGARVLPFEGEAGPGDAASSTERTVDRRRSDGAQVVAFPGQQRTHKRRRPEAPPAPSESEREPSGAHKAQTPKAITPPAEPAPERPRFLASELLRQDWYPRAPLSRSIRWGALALGAAGAAAVIALGATSTSALTIAGLLGACALLGAVPLRPQIRGVGLALIAVAGTALAASMRVGGDVEPAAPLLVGCVTLSASALFFRAAHRTARFARALVGIGLAATAAWLVLTGGLEALVVESLAWHHWIFPSLRLLLGLLVVSSLLTFLDPTGDGGAWVAGGGFLVWLGLETIASIAVGVWADGGSGVSLGDPAWIARLVFPVLAALAAGGLCQVWVLVSRAPNGKREAPSRTTIA